ncbi:MAG: glutathionylspermidine synthase family protein [Firmicutes bacterium]|nr:glutathionylspermidine synthase family protein [Bacillota bacterium]
MSGAMFADTSHFRFAYFLPPAASPERLYGSSPYLMEASLWQALLANAEAAAQQSLRIAVALLQKSDRFPPWGQPALPVWEAVAALQEASDAPWPLFYARADLFRSYPDGFFLSEINWDKPVGLRELLIQAALGDQPARHAQRQLAIAFEQQVRAWLTPRHRRWRVAAVVDPGHTEELYTAALGLQCLTSYLGIEGILATPANLWMRHGHAVAFGEPIDVIWRLWPIEFLQEWPQGAALLQAHARHQLVILNDPRYGVAQAKSWMALLWRDAGRGGAAQLPSLNDETARALRLVPYTRSLADLRDDGSGFGDGEAFYQQLQTAQRSWVLKPVFGRYGEGVVRGCKVAPTVWQTSLSHAFATPNAWIAQEEGRPLVEDGYGLAQRPHEQRATANLGLFLLPRTEGRLHSSGALVRLFHGDLTREENSWFRPLRVMPTPKVRHLPSTLDSDSWLQLHDRLAFEEGYLAGFTGPFRYFEGGPVCFSSFDVQRFALATEVVSGLLAGALRWVQRFPDPFLGLLGLSPALYPAALCEEPALCGVLRLDWGLGEDGLPRLLEVNADTPAGWVESAVLNARLLRQVGFPRRADPNRFLRRRIVASLLHWAQRHLGYLDARHVLAFVAPLRFREDWSQQLAFSEWVAAALRRKQGVAHKMPEVLLGDLSELRLEGGRVYLREQSIDVLARLWPLEWWPAEGGTAALLPEVAAGRLPLYNPSQNIVLQSKGLLALLWQLVQQRGVFTASQRFLALRYLLPAQLDPPPSQQQAAWVAKPFFSREGIGVLLGDQVPFPGKEMLSAEPYLYQRKARLPLLPDGRSLTISTFLVDGRFSGLFLRAGQPITDYEAAYLPVAVLEGSKEPLSAFASHAGSHRTGEVRWHQRKRAEKDDA